MLFLLLSIYFQTLKGLELLGIIIYDWETNISLQNNTVSLLYIALVLNASFFFLFRYSSYFHKKIRYFSIIYLNKLLYRKNNEQYGFTKEKHFKL